MKYFLLVTADHVVRGTIVVALLYRRLILLDFTCYYCIYRLLLSHKNRLERLYNLPVRSDCIFILLYSYSSLL